MLECKRKYSGELLRTLENFELYGGTFTENLSFKPMTTCFVFLKAINLMI